MREIEFRGWSAEREEWIYGTLAVYGYARCEPRNLIIPSYASALYGIDVERDSIGQYTGLRDSKRTEEFPEGQKIFEGDICLASLKYFNIKNEMSRVIFKNGCFCFQYGYSEDFVKIYSAWDLNTVEVIGNIHENPELLG